MPIWHHQEPSKYGLESGNYKRIIVSWDATEEARELAACTRGQTICTKFTSNHALKYDAKTLSENGAKLEASHRHYQKIDYRSAASCRLKSKIDSVQQKLGRKLSS